MDLNIRENEKFIYLIWDFTLQLHCWILMYSEYEYPNYLYDDMGSTHKHFSCIWKIMVVWRKSTNMTIWVVSHFFMENHFYLKEWLTNYQVKIKNLENLYLSLWALAVSQDFYDKKGGDNKWCFDII